MEPQSHSLIDHKMKCSIKCIRLYCAVQNRVPAHQGRSHIATESVEESVLRCIEESVSRDFASTCGRLEKKIEIEGLHGSRASGQDSVSAVVLCAIIGHFPTTGAPRGSRLDLKASLGHSRQIHLIGSRAVPNGPGEVSSVVDGHSGGAVHADGTLRVAVGAVNPAPSLRSGFRFLQAPPGIRSVFERRLNLFILVAVGERQSEEG